MKRAPRRVKPVRRTAAMVIGDGLLLVLTLVGLFFFQFNVYGLPGSRLVVLAACLAAAALFLTVFSLPKHRWTVVLAVIAVGLILLARYWDSVFRGAQVVYSTVAHVITESTDFPGEFPIPKSWTREEINAASNYFLTALIFVLGLPLGWAVVRRRAFLPVLLLTLPWLIPIFLAEFLPDVVSLSLLTASWIALLLSGLTTRRDSAGGARLTLIVLPAALLVLFCICRIFPMESYVYPDWAASAAQRLTEWGEQAGESVLSGGGSSGAPSSIDLTRCGPRRFTGRSVLRVESDWSGRLYLRGAAYADYTGESWECLSDEARAELDEIGLDTSSYFVLARDTGERTYSAAITHLSGSSRMAYYPYRPINLPAISGGVRYMADSYLRLEKPQGTYSMEFSDAYGLNLMVGDEAYRQFVYEHYLDVPGELADILAGMWEEELISVPVSSPHAYKIALAWKISDLLETITEYDLQTPVTPEGEDFVAYFLTESHRGYCVHYASAATMLLRMQGIPARYVSGYTAQIEDGETLVPDSAAHAWVEIYLDGYGWYPVEVTPAAAFSDAAAGEESPVVSDPVEKPTPSAELSEQPAQSETHTPSETPSAKPSENPGQAGTEGPGTADEKPADLSWLVYVVVALVLLGLPILIRALRRRRWNRLTAMSDHNRAVLETYRWYQKLTPWGGESDPRLEELARKAKFSQHTLTAQERREAVLILRREIARLSAIPSWKRPLFRYLFVWK